MLPYARSGAGRAAYATLLSFGLAVSLPHAAKAQSYHPGDTVQDGFFVEEQRANSQINLVPTPTYDANGSLQFIVGTGSKVQIDHSANIALDMLTGATSGKLTFDNYVASSGATNAAPAYRIYFNGNSGDSLVWEASYNPVIVGTQTWQTFDLTNGKFWEHAGGTNYNGGSDAYTLSQWLNPSFSPASGAVAGNAPAVGDVNIIGYSLGLGSGLPYSYNGNIDHVNFNGHVTDFNANIGGAPEPSEWAALGFTAFGIGGLLLRARKRKANVAG